MSQEIDDIKRVLAICFRDGSSQTSDDIERILSFDMGWFDTDTAHDAIKALIFAGWIIDESGMLSPNCDIRGMQAPLGWQPRPSRLTDPVINEMNREKQANIMKSEPDVEHEKIPVVPKKEPPKSEDIDPRARIEKRLIRFISKQSGIEADEIQRRAERKVKALRYCTIWLALCLISREQNLEMNSIIDSFSSR